MSEKEENPVFLSLSKQELTLVALISLLTFILVYAPHLNYHYPLHVDEWHHITEAIKLKQGIYSLSWATSEPGFHFFLYILSFPLNLVNDYQFFAASWAVISALALFWIVLKKTSSFETALFAMIFFSSLKSNVNLLGIWFFTPLSFAIPFIFLYVYFFTEGIQQENKSYLIASLIIMILTVFIHFISLLFAVPMLLIYIIVYHKKSMKQWKTLIPFILIPILGLLLFSAVDKTPMLESLKKITSDALVFEKGWGVSELNNSPLEIYSISGYILAIIGFLTIIFRKQAKQYLIYLIWPLCVLASIAIFRIWSVSFLSPYQRNVYYFAISMPFLSAIGLQWLISLIGEKTDKIRSNKRELIKGAIIVISLLAILILTFVSYFSIPSSVGVYAVTDQDGYNALNFLKTLERGNVLAPLSISTAMFPVSGQTPIGTMYFYGNKDIVEKFFASEDCQNKTQIIKDNSVNYILIKTNETEKELECNWSRLYKEGNYTIYKF